MIASLGQFDHLLPLELLAAGECADVADISGEPAWVGHMAALGLRTGSRVRVLQPGSPCLLCLGDHRLSIRSEGTAQILVRPVSPEGSGRA